MDRGDLADMWREASVVFQELQTAEAGAADKPQILPLSKRTCRRMWQQAGPA
jgi:hypothetical protein